ncbi:MAG: hypothetical protein TE42_06835 [Candidatus Synechococcus spongiarum SP3]|uniref:Uncharacterized protein n=1 Tax=Candidatus Synechococcus spongiarum SP3 TaxID=1604020 RepID=A0A0G2HLF9_9SYNE|nr:MAG: hypothetical protein TE42_06835 [Candidatus Synechococcus spongiarum SP3]
MAIGINGRLQIALLFQDIAQVEIGLWKVGVDSQCFAIGIDSSLQITLVLQGIAQIVIGFWIVGVDGNSLSEQGDDLLCSPLHPADGGQVAKDCGADDPFFNQLSVDDFSVLKATVLQLLQGVSFLFLLHPVHRAWLARR